jgi:hypothetical protein
VDRPKRQWVVGQQQQLKQSTGTSLAGEFGGVTNLVLAGQEGFDGEIKEAMLGMYVSLVCDDIRVTSPVIAFETQERQDYGEIQEQEPSCRGGRKNNSHEIMTEVACPMTWLDPRLSWSEALSSWIDGEPSIISLR